MTRLILPLLAATFVAAPAAAEVQVTNNGPVVELTVHESVEAEPDLVTVSAGVTSQARTAVEAMRANAQAMTAVIDRIKALGVPERDIQTTGVNLGAMYDYNQATQRQVFRGYQASNRVTIVLRKVENAGKVLDALVAAGATDIGGPDFSLEDNTAALAQARKAAMLKAGAQASAYADMAGYKGFRLLEIDEVQSSFGPPMPYARLEMANAAKAPTPVEPGLVANSVTITVKYELTNQ